jgi:hypothetical protein
MIMDQRIDDLGKDVPMRGRTKRAVALAVALLCVGGSAGQSRPLKPEQEAKIKPDGKAEDCIPLRSIRNTRVRDDRTIDFYMNNGKVYRNTLPYACSGLGYEERFGYATSLPQLCSVDIITVLRTPPIPIGAPCGLGKFQPISGAPK